MDSFRNSARSDNSYVSDVPLKSQKIADVKLVCTVAVRTVALPFIILLGTIFSQLLG